MVGGPRTVARIGEEGCDAGGQGHVDAAPVLAAKQAKGGGAPGRGGTVVPTCDGRWPEWCHYAAALGFGSRAAATLWHAKAGLMDHWPELGRSEPAGPTHDVGCLREGGEGGVQLGQKGLWAKSEVAAWLGG